MMRAYEVQSDTMHSTPRYILLFLLFMNYGPALAQGRGDRPSLSARIQALASARYQATGCPGLSVAVASQNRVIFSQAFGFADLEQGVRLTTCSAHRLASLSKPVTATIIMELVQQGRLSLGASIRRYLPELPEAYQDVTIRHLLTHQSGARGYRNVEGVAFSVTHYGTTREAIKAFTDDPPLFAPGTKTEYSSYGFALLGAAAEAVTGRTFQGLSADFFSRHAISGFSLDDALALVPGRVRGYRIDDKGKLSNARAYDMSIRYPSGGFVASAEDYLRFVISVSSGRAVTTETVRGMWAAQKLNDGSASPFGLGWGVGELRGAEWSDTTGCYQAPLLSCVFSLTPAWEWS
jgi:serine beta-lactamase-like protein LACTB